MIVLRIGAVFALLFLAGAALKDLRVYGQPSWPYGEFHLFVTFLLTMALFTAAAVAGNIAGDYAVAVKRGTNAGDDILRQGATLGYVAMVLLTVATVGWVVLR